MPTARTGDIQTFYEDESPAGAGHHAAAVLVHGHSADHRIWHYQAPALAQAGYRCVRYDVRGHGRSSVTEDGYTWEQYSADLFALLNHLQISEAHLAGSSMGGGIALQFAIDHPERTASLTLIDSALPGFTYSDEFTAQIEQLVEAVRSKGAREAFERLWLEHPFFDGVRRFPERFGMLRDIVLEYPAADYRDGAVPEGYQPTTTDHLYEIAAPVLVIAGEHDIPDFRLVADLLAANLPNARQLVMPDCWHLPMLEHPAEFNAALIEFLDGPVDSLPRRLC